MVEDHQEVEVTVRAFLAASHGAEQDDLRRMSCRHDVRHDRNTFHGRRLPGGASQIIDAVRQLGAPPATATWTRSNSPEALSLTR